jgi:hypothetical protein
MSTSRKTEASIRQGGPGASHENAEEPKAPHATCQAAMARKIATIPTSRNGKAGDLVLHDERSICRARKEDSRTTATHIGAEVRRAKAKRA